MHPKLFKLEAIFEDYEHVNNMNVLGASDAETFTIKDLLATDALRQLGNLSLGYDDVKGRESLRDAVARSYGANFSARNVLITVGASEAILLVLHVLLSPGDIALVCSPAYQGLYELAEIAGARVIPYNYVEENQFVPDLDAVRKTLEEFHPKVLVLNSPHNPTGHVLDEKTLGDLLTRAKAVGTQVIVDEVFSGLWIKPTVAVPSAITLDPQSVVIGCLSKVYGLAGLRLGWVIGQPELIDKFKQLRYYTTLSPPSIVQQLAELALENRVEILKRSQANVDHNYEHALRWLDLHREFFDWLPPQGGTVMLLRLKLSVNTEDFARYVADEYKVFLVPCTTGFGMTHGYLRLGLAGNQEKFQEGLDTLSQCLREGRWVDRLQDDALRGKVESVQPRELRKGDVT